MQAGLYIHFPFCLKKCLYCDFNSTAWSGDELDGYVELLLREMELRRQALPEPVQAPTLYLGGGTPSLMAPELVGRLIDQAALRFGLEQDAEVTLEANPGTLTPERLAGYRAAGVNRLSLGIQSFEERLLKTLGRVHTVPQALAAFEQARRAGFDNISIDLMHSLPGQSLDDWRAALAQGIALAPEHVSAYALSVEEGTPFEQLYQHGELVLPGEEEAARMFEATAEMLTGAGYLHYEISNFGLPGRFSRHNQSYWSRASYLGFGSGAHSFWNPDGLGRRWNNAADLDGYRAAIDAGLLPERDEVLLSLEDAVAESFFLGLRVLTGLELAPLEERFGADALAGQLAEVERLLQAGLLVADGKRIRLADSSVIIANSIFSRFL
ncbi:radical SAM family heme chaperone HemW [Geomonas paludis]|uniref:Heme chaperone HemW n=1 Tax=Geomonas paludis TaxID=2740185 RepID=A0A6V8N1Z7_9BACT|nr:radical SAM family heme chaperone HemW [Geomonas paludis]UPU36692.1 radical SAM family heme chaperone HemW [Geomonas paludis]GFO65927.1 coproporphyrinogen III oxidase [Geomonas paludis]